MVDRVLKLFLLVSFEICVYEKMEGIQALQEFQCNWRHFFSLSNWHHICLKK